MEGDITACFDEISHPALMDRVRERIGDKRVLALVKAFLKAGILSRETGLRETHTGTPQGGILSPLLSNIALSVLDDHFVGEWDGVEPLATRTAPPRGRGVWRFVRYADDFVILVRGDRHHAEALREQTAAILAPMGLRLSQAKTLITHIDEGLDFLGWRIQRRRRPGDSRRFVYTYPSKKALASIVGKVKKICRHDPNLELAPVLHQLNRALRGWTAYFRPGVSFATFAYLRAFTWRQVMNRLRRKHRRINWKDLRRRYCDGGWWPKDGEVILFNPTDAGTTRYRYRGTRIPRRGLPQHEDHHRTHQGPRGEPDAVKAARPVREAGRRNGLTERSAPRCGPTSHGKGPRRSGREPARLRRDRGQPGWRERRPRPVGRDRR